MVDKKLSQFDEVSTGDVSYFPILDKNTKNAKIAGTKAMPWTNCITEIPQDINLTLSNGTLTLKAGSKVYMPNGSETFRTVTTTTDKTYSYTTNGKFLIICAQDGIMARCNYPATSGATQPSSPTVGDLWYDTTNNYCKRYNGSKWENKSFPIAIVTISGGAISSIDQVFNGFGYIGSSIFALPGIKGLIPNGRNKDGTLNNLYLTCNGVVVRTFPVSENFIGAQLFFNGSSFGRLGRNSYSYNQNENYIYNVNNRFYLTLIGSLDITAGVVSNFNTKPAFHAVDYSDFKQADDENVKITGDQTITGTKTFNTVNGIQATVSGSNNIIQKNTAIDITDSSRTTGYTNGFTVQDKNEYVAGMFVTTFTTTGNVQSYMQARNRATGSQVQGQISITVDNAGNVTTSAPTPNVTDNSTKIATTQWFNNKIKVVSALPANPVNGVFYFITD